MLPLVISSWCEANVSGIAVKARGNEVVRLALERPGAAATVDDHARENRRSRSASPGRSSPHESDRQLRGDDVNVDRLTEARLQPAFETLEIERRLVAHVSDNRSRPGSLRPTRTGRSRVRARGGASRRLN